VFGSDRRDRLFYSTPQLDPTFCASDTAYHADMKSFKKHFIKFHIFAKIFRTRSKKFQSDPSCEQALYASPSWFSTMCLSLGLSEVAKSFNFKLAEFGRIASANQRRKQELRVGLLRKPFVGFAMLFLEVEKPWLLQWVLQQREMYSGLLRRLGSDDDETVVFVLTVLRERI